MLSPAVCRAAWRFPTEERGFQPTSLLKTRAASNQAVGFRTLKRTKVRAPPRDLSWLAAKVRGRELRGNTPSRSFKNNCAKIRRVCRGFVRLAAGGLLRGTGVAKAWAYEPDQL